MSTPTEDAVTVQSALKNAAQLLRNAELESDLTRMERIEQLAACWVEIARLLKGDS
jgi:hypothetical protein